MGGQTAEYAATCRLLDGRLVSLRRLSADDAEAVAALHQNLTDHDRYLRFFTLNPAHLDQLVKELTEPGVGQCAVGAFDGDRLIGVAITRCPPTRPLPTSRLWSLKGTTRMALERRCSSIWPKSLQPRDTAVRSRRVGRNDLMFQVLFDFGWPRKRLSYGAVSHLEFELPNYRPGESTAADEFSSRGVRDVLGAQKIRSLGLCRRIGGI